MNLMLFKAEVEMLTERKKLYIVPISSFSSCLGQVPYFISNFFPQKGEIHCYYDLFLYLC